MKFIIVSGESDFGAEEYLNKYSEKEMLEHYNQAMINDNHKIELMFSEFENYENNEHDPDSIYEEILTIQAINLNIDEDAFYVLQDVWANYDSQKCSDIIPLDF